MELPAVVKRFAIDFDSLPEVHSGLQRERRHRVAQIVQADRRDARSTDRLLEHLQQSLRVVRLAGLVDEHVAGVRPRGSERQPLGPLTLAVRIGP